MESKIPVRYSKPTEQSHAPYGTVVRVITDDKSYEHYIQISDDETKPEWHSIGYVLEKAFQPHIDNELFITECLNLYKHHENKPFFKLLQIMQSSDN